MSEKKLRLWKGGLWGGPDSRNSSRPFFFFFLSQSLSLPLACGWSKKRGASETEREKEEREREEERRRQRAHSEGEKCSADDEIGGAAERANESLFHHMSNTARNCICTGDGGEGGRKGGREHKMGGRRRHRRKESEREGVGGWKALNVGGVEEE